MANLATGFARKMVLDTTSTGLGVIMNGKQNKKVAEYYFPFHHRYKTFIAIKQDKKRDENMIFDECLRDSSCGISIPRGGEDR